MIRDSRIEIVNQDVIEPGGSGIVRIWVSENFPVEKLELNMPFELHEGARTIAIGLITALLSND